MDKDKDVWIDDEEVSKVPSGFQHGNSLWRLRKTTGRPRVFKEPDDLWNAAVDYFAWTEENPLMEVVAFHNKGLITKTRIPRVRAMTISGLCIHIGLSSTTWYEMKTEYSMEDTGEESQDELRRKRDFADIITRIDEIIRDQKFVYAAADMLNANIIARDLGLGDRKLMELMPPTTIILEPATAEDAEENDD